MTLDEEFRAHLDALQGTVAESREAINTVVDWISDCFRRGGMILVCGNGGSAADSQHFAAEFMNRFRINRRPWPAIALSTDTSVLTSIANDSAFEDVFARQVEALGGPGDVLIATSTSGGAKNVLNALRVARSRGMATVALTGIDGASRLGPEADAMIVVPSRVTARIQEAHEFVYHYIAGAVEERLASA
jgi:D-sedoheptulose 7-phosphate isomerase